MLQVSISSFPFPAKYQPVTRMSSIKSQVGEYTWHAKPKPAYNQNGQREKKITIPSTNDAKREVKGTISIYIRPSNPVAASMYQPRPITIYYSIPGKMITSRPQLFFFFTPSFLLPALVSRHATVSSRSDSKIPGPGTECTWLEGQGARESRGIDKGLEVTRVGGADPCPPGRVCRVLRLDEWRTQRHGDASSVPWGARAQRIMEPALVFSIPN